MPRAHRYFIPGHVWHIVALAHPWATRHKNIHVQNTSLSQERIPAQVCKRPPTLAALVI